MSITTWHLPGLVFIPLQVGMKSMNFMAWTPNEHIVGLRHVLCFFDQT